MTPSEWALLQDGAAEARQQADRTTAHWVSLLLTATAGTVVTAAQLLGEDDTADSKKRDRKQQTAAERKYKAMMRRIAKQKQKEKECQA